MGPSPWPCVPGQQRELRRCQHHAAVHDGRANEEQAARGGAQFTGVRGVPGSMLGGCLLSLGWSLPTMFAMLAALAASRRPC